MESHAILWAEPNRRSPGRGTQTVGATATSNESQRSFRRRAGKSLRFLARPVIVYGRGFYK